MNEKDDELDLLQIWQVIKKNLVLFISICVLTCTIGFAVSKFVLPKKYTATAKIIIVKEDNGNTASSVTYSDIQLSQKLASTYKQILMSEAISDEVIKNLKLDEKYNINTEKFENMLSVSAADSTEVMSIKTVSTDPKLSADISNEVVKVFMSKIYDIMEVQNVAVLNDAKVPERKSSPSTIKWTAIGGFAGIILCAFIAVIKTLTDTKVKTEEEVKAIFPDYPIIGTIPNFEVKEDRNDDEQI